jgi:hypothetical protein
VLRHRGAPADCGEALREALQAALAGLPVAARMLAAG